MMATKEQTNMIVGKVIKHMDEFSVLRDEEVSYIIDHPEEAIRLAVGAISDHTRSREEAGKTVSFGAETFSVNPAPEQFTAGSRFRKDVVLSFGLKFCFIGEEFLNDFAGKVESPFPGSVIRTGCLSREMSDSELIMEIGGPGAIETTLWEMYRMIQSQPCGKAGSLLCDARANIFYIRNTRAILRAVGLRWHKGWCLNSFPIEKDRGWAKGDRIYCRLLKKF